MDKLTTGGHPEVFAVERSSPVPLYRQLEEQMRSVIESGAWADGYRLPSERTLTALLDVSRVTVRQALNALVVDGLIISVAGKGYYVVRLRPMEGLDVAGKHALGEGSSLLRPRRYHAEASVLDGRARRWNG